MSTDNRYLLTFVNNTNDDIKVRIRRCKSKVIEAGENAKFVARAQINSEIVIQIRRSSDSEYTEFELPAQTDVYTVRSDLSTQTLFLVPQSLPTARIDGNAPSYATEQKDGQVVDDTQADPAPSADAWADGRRRRHRRRNRGNSWCQVVTGLLGLAVVVGLALRVVY